MDIIHRQSDQHYCWLVKFNAISKYKFLQCPSLSLFALLVLLFLYTVFFLPKLFTIRKSESNAGLVLKNI